GPAHHDGRRPRRPDRCDEHERRRGPRRAPRVVAGAGPRGRRRRARRPGVRSGRARGPHRAGSRRGRGRRGRLGHPDLRARGRLRRRPRQGDDGWAEREVRTEPAPGEAEAAGVDSATLTSELEGASAVVPGGETTDGPNALAVEVGTPQTDLEAIEDTPIRTADGTVLLGDIADVSL